MSFGIERDDYNEGKCCNVEHGNIPADRVLDKLDAYFAADDFAGAERHLKYWMEEAKQLNDMQGLLLLFNECIGFYRKSNDADSALKYAERALKLAEDLGYRDSVTMATTFINVATAYCAFGEYGTALPYYENAKELYEKHLGGNDGRLGGLYNNMALCLMALDDTDRAGSLFESALSVMEKVPGGEPSMAITYCNIADLIAKVRGDADGEQQINECLEKAMALLDGVAERRDGNYAYACEKCAPAFGHYGYFFYEDVLLKRARGIYEGN